MGHPATLAAIVLALTAVATAATGQAAPGTDSTARAVFKQLIEINTSHSVGSTTVAADAMAGRFRAAGFPAGDVQVVGLAGSKNHNLVVRYRGTGSQKPIAFIAHLDVVEARREDWSLDPFLLTERDGFFYGRGTSDQKGGAATLVAAFIRLRREGFRPSRDLILALTGGEESGGDYNGIDWLLKNQPGFKDVEYCVNVDSGEPQVQGTELKTRPVQVAEKVSFNLTLEVTNPGGHSSLPVKDNAIYRLAAGLTRLGGFDFPVHLSELTRLYFERTAGVETGATALDLRAVAGCQVGQTTTCSAAGTAAAARLAALPFYNATLRTTCVATMMDAGHAVNALPQRARANVNCRMLPFESADSVQASIARVLADTAITVTRASEPRLSPPSPLTGSFLPLLERVTGAAWPGARVIPYMETGGTDGIYFRNLGIPTYGVSGIPLDMGDFRAHGRDERIGVRHFDTGVAYIYGLTKAVGESR